ncbi:MAG: twin-arginine translocation signal domain-containing protein, partial [Acidobacteria bacterium]
MTGLSAPAAPALPVENTRQEICMNPVNRRQFLKTGSAAAAALPF